MTLRRSIVSTFPTMSSNSTGRYFSTLNADELKHALAGYHGSSYPVPAAESWAAFAFPVAAVDDSARVAIIADTVRWLPWEKWPSLRHRTRSQIGTKLDAPRTKIAASSTATSTSTMVNAASEDIIADPRAAITKLFGLDRGSVRR